MSLTVAMPYRWKRCDDARLCECFNGWKESVVQLRWNDQGSWVLLERSESQTPVFRRS